MNLINNKQFVQEEFYVTPSNLMGLRDEGFTTRRESPIAIFYDRWDGVERRKIDRDKRRLSRLTDTEQMVKMRVPNGALSSGQMGLEPSEVRPQVITEPVSGRKWWVEIFTAQPFCLYYFGDFQTFQQARILKQGFKQDLLDEGSTIISLAIKYCSPQQLTIRSSELTTEVFEQLQSEMIYGCCTE